MSGTHLWSMTGVAITLVANHPCHPPTQAQIHTGFHRFTEIRQNFHNKKKSIDMDIFLIKVNCKLNLENSFDIYFLFILFCLLPEIDKSHRHILAAKFYSREITSLLTVVTPSHHRRGHLDQNYISPGNLCNSATWVACMITQRLWTMTSTRVWNT